ncbi:hypothetical protein BCR35DRAFT_63107 [Leucosporidium creatinivorum]|uniref:Uncharacterized protein n=1 Tax=Leucosporidium creatinivorum TaxID=106004 RepID=A0A1Y2FKU3_9BASI|nr:hypothetical protein BCR35DRAFT_63107 [Leucosporidium creatinivorum]
MEAFCRVQFGPAQGAFLSDIRMVQDPTLLARTLEAFKSMAIIYNNEKVPGIIVCWYESLREDLIGLNHDFAQVVDVQTGRSTRHRHRTRHRRARFSIRSPFVRDARLYYAGPQGVYRQELATRYLRNQDHGWKARRCRRGQQDISSSSRIEAQEDSWEGEGGRSAEERGGCSDGGCKRG